MEKMKKHFLRRMALVMALLTLGSAVLVGCGGQKEPEPDPKDEVIVEPEPIQLPDSLEDISIQLNLEFSVLCLGQIFRNIQTQTTSLGSTGSISPDKSL